MESQEFLTDEFARPNILDELGILNTPAEDRFDQITALACRLFNVPIAVVSIVSEDTLWLKSTQGLDATEVPRERSFCERALQSKDTLVIQDTHQDPEFVDHPFVMNEPNIRFYAGHPFKYKNIYLGTLCIIDQVPRIFSPSEIETLKTLASWVKNEIEYTGLNKSQLQLMDELEKAKREAMIDSLTTLWNRRGLDQLLINETERAKREEEHISIMLIDMDNFKEINDKYHHTTGDCVLREIAQRIRSTVRPNDIVARFGGDEFIVFLSNCNEKTARTTAQRILSKVQDEHIEYNDIKIAASVSIGVASTVATKELDIDLFIKKADEALYQAKHAGRHCVKSINYQFH